MNGDDTRWNDCQGERATTLRDLPLCAPLNHETRASLAVMAGWRTYAAGQQVDRPRQEGDECLVVQGLVTVSMDAEAGRRLVMFRLRAGELFDFGERESERLFENAVAAVAEADGTRICCIPWPVFVCTIMTHPDSARLAFEQLRLRCRVLERLAGDIALLRVPARVRHVLYDRAIDNESHVVDFTVDQLADLAATSRYQASREVATLTRKGILFRRGKGHITVPDPDGLL